MVFVAACLWAVTGTNVGHGGSDELSMDRSETTHPWWTTTTATSTTTTTTTTTTTLPSVATAPPATTPTTEQLLQLQRSASAPIEDDPVPRVAAPAGAPPVVGRIIVPRIGLDVGYFEGGTTAQIDYGPSHMPHTANPGHDGNVVIAGHRVTYTHPFRDLDKMQPGDTVTFVVSYGTFTYEFTHHEIITEDETDILRPYGGRTATLFACHPPGSSQYRIVARFKLISKAANGVEGAQSKAETYAPVEGSPTTDDTTPTPTSSTSTSLVLPGRK